jgi:hypothetical protein
MLCIDRSASKEAGMEIRLNRRETNCETSLQASCADALLRVTQSVMEIQLKMISETTVHGVLNNWRWCPKLLDMVS